MVEKEGGGGEKGSRREGEQKDRREGQRERRREGEEMSKSD